MKIKQTIIVMVLGIVLAVAVSPVSVDALGCGGVKTSIVECPENQTATCADGSDPYSDTNDGICDDGKNPVIAIQDTGVWGILRIAIKIMTGGIFVLAVAGIVYGAFLYTTAADAADKVKKSKDIFTNVVIGVLAYALMYSILNFIVPGGVF